MDLLNKKNSSLKKMTLRDNKNGVFFLEIAIIIIFIISIHTFIISQIETGKEQEEKYFSLELKKIQAKHLCSQLISSSGNPSNWNNASSIVLLGIKEENSKQLSSTKIQVLDNIDKKTRNQLKLKSFEVEARYLNNDSIISTMNNRDIDTSKINYVSHSCFGINENNEEVKIEVRVK